MAKPFLKWAGGKSQLMPEIMQRLPDYVYEGLAYQYVEPFGGSGAVALHLLDSPYPPSKIILNDINSDLINLYKVIKSHPNELLNYLKVIQGEYDKLEDKEAKQPYYYDKRDSFNKRTADAIEHAGIFIFLNRAGFNGLYRVNSKNNFNVPIGSYNKPNFVFEDVILNASRLLANVEICNNSFEDILKLAIEENKAELPTFFYLDPPYKPLNESSSFTSYAKGSFDDDDQIKLKECCDLLDNHGYQWLLSNSDTTNLDTNNRFFDDLYENYTIERVRASRSINSKGSKRGQINELLIRNYEKMQELYRVEHFAQLVETLNQKGILQYDYFVNWSKVLTKIAPIETELHILNAAVGKEDIEGALFNIFKEYPKTVKAIPALLAIRSNSIDILIDKTNYIHRHFDFKHRDFTDDDLNNLVEFVMKCGLGTMMQDRHIRNIPDYCTGVEVGLDSNARKNRGGTQMEQLVESFVALFCHENDLEYLPQASMNTIRKAWGIDVKIGSASKNIDFVIYKKSSNKLYFIECNFYSTGGSKLKSTASEYTKMSELWKAQGIGFIWVTDGQGWLTATKPLRDYFDEGNYLVNIDMLQKGYLEKIIL